MKKQHLPTTQNLCLYTKAGELLGSPRSLPIMLILLTLSTPTANAIDLSYSGRLAEESGKSFEGPLSMKVQFYTAPTGGDPIGPTLEFRDTELRDGVFQLTLSLTPAQVNEIFGDGLKAVYIQVEAQSRIFERHRFMAVPTALKVPVDQSTLTFNGEGKLTVDSISISQVTGLSALLSGKADSASLSSVSATTIKPANNLSDLSDPSTARTNLGLGSLATKTTIGTADLDSGAVTDAKIASITTPGKVSGDAVTAGTIGGTATFSGSGGIATAGSIAGSANFLVNPAAGTPSQLRFGDGDNSNYVSLRAPTSVSSNVIWTLPAVDGGNGQVLATNGSGTLSWASPAGAGTVTSVGITAPAAGIAVSGGPVTGAGSMTLSLSDDLAAVEGISGTGSVERTGANTWGTYTVTAAGKAILDDADVTAQRTTLGLGSLATASTVSGGTGGTISDDTITDADINSAAAIAQSKISGLTTSLSGKEPTIASGTTAQFYRGDKSWYDFNTAARGAVSITAPLTYNSGTGVFGLGQAGGAADGYLASSDFLAFNSKQAAITAATTVNAGTVTTALQNGVEVKPYNTGAGQTGELRFDELAANGANYVAIKSPDDLTGNVVLTLPAGVGSSGQVLSTNGSGTLSWISPGGGGTVTSVGLTAPASGISVSGGPVTGAGSMTLSLSDDLAAVEGISGTGSVERTGLNTWGTYTVTAAGKALIDDADATAQRTTLGLGALATAATVSGGTGGTITDDSITDADINSAAAIAQSKISGLSTSLSGKEPTIASGTTAQFYRGDKSWYDFNTAARGAVSISAPLTYNSSTGVFGLGQAGGAADGYLASSDFLAFNSKQAAITAATTVNAGTVTTALQNGVEVKPYNTGAGQTGELRFDELAANGTNYVGFKAPDVLGTDRIWTLPSGDGTSGQMLSTNGSGVLAWASATTGTVTSVGITAPPAGISVSGGPVTSSGSLTLSLADDLAAVEGISGTGSVERTGANTWGTYTVTAAGKAILDDTDATAQRTTLGLGSLATLSAVGSSEISDLSIMNVDINASAAIATSKLSGAVTAITGHGLGSLATLSTVGSAEISNNSIMDTDINASAAIATSKLSGAVTSITGHGLGALATVGAVSGGTAGTITDDTITNADINSAAAIADTKLATISTAGKVSGSAITSGTIGGSTAINTSGLITTSGNVGIGTTAPRGGFDYAGSSDVYLANSLITGSAQSLYLPGHIFITPYSGTNTAYLQARRSDASGSLGLQLRTTNSGSIVDAMYLSPSGNIGIGTTAPAAKLDLNAGNLRVTTVTSPSNLSLNGGTDGHSTGGYIALGYGSGASWPGSAVISGGATYPGYGNTPGAKITLEGSSYSTSPALLIQAGRSYTGGNDGTISFADASGNIRTRILSNGNVGIGTTSPGGLLDIGAASEFRVASTGDVTKIKGVAYSWPSSQGSASTVLTNNGSGTLSWATPSGGGGGLTSCPSGFTMIGTSGKRGTFCIDTDERTAAAWLDAQATCQDLNLTEGAALMCNQNEWRKACRAGTPTGMTGAWEWVAEFYNYGIGYAIAAGSSSCESLNADYMTTAYVFRCCVR